MKNQNGFIDAGVALVAVGVVVVGGLIFKNTGGSSK